MLADRLRSAWRPFLCTGDPLRQTAGRIPRRVDQCGVTELDGNPVNIVEIRRETGMVFEHFNLFPHVMIFENYILAPTRARKQARAKAKEIAMGYRYKVKPPRQADQCLWQ